MLSGKNVTLNHMKMLNAINIICGIKNETKMNETFNWKCELISFAIRKLKREKNELKTNKSNRMIFK